MASKYSEAEGSNGAMPAVDSIMTLSPEEYAQAALDKLFGTGPTGQVSSREVVRWHSENLISHFRTFSFEAIYADRVPHASVNFSYNLPAFPIEPPSIVCYIIIHLISS